MQTTLCSRGLVFCLPGQVHHHHTTGCGLPQERKANIAIIQPAEAKTATIYRRIGSTTYKLWVHFSDTAQETMNDKILHLIQHEAMTNAADCGTMNIPQMTQPLEGSSL
ncbi:transposon-encoded TnpW family protein [Oscillospiraceae bacterium 38-13]